MTKQEIIFELLKSLNKGNSGDPQGRVSMANYQYTQLSELGLSLDAKSNIPVPPNPEPKIKQ